MEKKINLAAKKTEYEWQKAMDGFLLTYIPKWYEFLNWIVLLGIFNFLTDLTKDWKIKTLYIISNVGLFFYLQSYFFNIHIAGIPLIKSRAAKRFFSLIIGGLISIGVYFLINSIIPKISGKV